LEFSNETPEKLIERLSTLGYKKALLVGGSIINGLFLKNNLVDELYLTIEPKIFGKGKNIVEEQSLDKSLQLINVKKLNKTGTLLLKYKINK
jgi:dihydrofolate reductase